VVAYASGDYALARERWDDVQGLFEDNLDTQPRQNPVDWAPFYLLQGNARVYSAQYSAALPYYQAVLDPQEAQDVRAAAANNLGLAHFNHQLVVSARNQITPELSVALETYTTALQIKPGYLLPYLNRADAYVQIYQYEPALADCTTAISLSAGSSAAAYCCRAMVNIRKQESSVTEFLDDMQAACELEEQRYALPYSELGRYFRNNGREKEAFQAFSTYLDLVQQRPYLELDRCRIEEAQAFVDH
jgi:tetratricopeptide (TPR) repeat protein